MPSFDVNIQALFTESPFMDRFDQAAAAGFRGVEFPVPYQFDAAQISEKLNRFQLTMVLTNTPGGDPVTQRGLACQPALRDAFRQSILAAIDMATQLGCKLVHCPAGIEPADEDAERIAATYRDNLRFAARLFADAGLTLGIEPLNSFDLPGFHLSTSCQAMAIIDELDEPNIGLILDLYHLARMGEDLPDVVRAARGHIAHVQIADAPGKAEPGTGNIDFNAVFDALNEVGYSGWMGLEYRPRTTTLEGLPWLNPYRN